MQIVPHPALQASLAGTAGAGSITASPSGQRIDPRHEGPSQARLAAPLHAPARKAFASIRRWSAALPNREALRSSLAMLGNSLGRQLLSAHAGSREGAGPSRPHRGEASGVSAALKRLPQLPPSTASSHLHAARTMQSMAQALEAQLGPRSHAAVIAARLGARMTGPLIDMLVARGPLRRT